MKDSGFATCGLEVVTQPIKGKVNKEANIKAVMFFAIECSVGEKYN